MKTGDIVKLKSGGPSMTLLLQYSGTFCGPAYDYVCTWFDEKGEFCQEYFEREMLVRL